MIANKNVIELGLLASESALVSGLKNTYYIYRRANGDLYMYDSFKDVETNLFHLTIPAHGTLDLSSFKFNKGLLQIFTNKTNSGSLSLTTTKHDATEIPISSIQFVVKEIDTPNGVFMITTTKKLVGNISITVKETT